MGALAATRLLWVLAGAAVTLLGLSLIGKYGPTTRLVLLFVIRLSPGSPMAARQHVVPVGVVLLLIGIACLPRVL